MEQTNRGPKRSGMKNWGKAGVLAALLAFSPALFAQENGGAKAGNFDPHDLNGSWLGTGRIYGDNNSVPEPPLTDWARQHLMMPNISHAGLNAVIKGASSAGSLPNGAKSVDANGVPATSRGALPRRILPAAGHACGVQLYKRIPDAVHHAAGPDLSDVRVSPRMANDLAESRPSEGFAAQLLRGFDWQMGWKYAGGGHHRL